jgi:hypothetical protein
MRQSALVLSTAACVLLGAPALAQQPAPAPTGAIAGTLTSADLGRPIRKAQVRIQSSDPRVTRTTTSDAEGRFVFEGLPPADYQLTAAKAGYVEMAFGARLPGAGVPGTPLTLGPGQTLDRIALRLPRGGVISGVVTDEYGDPAIGVPVRAMRFSYRNGQRVAVPAGNAVTDDIGGYRIASLLPGEYVVAAVPRETVAATSAAAESLRVRQEEIMAKGSAVERQRLEQSRRDAAASPREAAGYVPAFFGGTATPSAASPVRLGLSQHAGAVDIQLIALKTGTLSGTVTGPDGAPTMASVQLLDPLMPIAGLAVWFRHPGADGRFTFGGIVPGTYVLRAQRVQKVGSAGDGEFTATTTVHVPEGAEVDASVTLTRGIAVSGTVQRGDLTVDDLQKMQVTLYPILGPSDWEAPAPRATPDADGRFAISPVGPGPHRVRVDGLPRGWAVESAIFAGIDAADVDLEIGREEIGDGRVTLASTTSELSGAVTDAKGEPARGRTVVLFPDDPQLWVPLSRRIHVVQTGADGRYAFRSLPAGDYRVTVADLSDSGQQFDRDFLAGIAPGAVAVTLAAGAARTANISYDR